jgi:hypothetical protein
VKKRAVELRVMKERLVSEMRMKERVDDEYGVDRINAMIAGINAEYAAMGVNVDVTHDAGIVGTEGDEDAEEEESDNDHEPRSSKRYVYFHANNLYSIAYVLSTIFSFFTHRRRVSTSTASQQHIHPLHWSRRVTLDNPHGFADKVFARLRAIEDPDEREKEEKKLLAKRRWNEKQRSNAETAARQRDHQNEKNRLKKINAGYVMLVALQLKTVPVLPVRY